MRGDHGHRHMRACLGVCTPRPNTLMHRHKRNGKRGAARQFSESKMSVLLASFDHNLSSVILHTVHLAVK